MSADVTAQPKPKRDPRWVLDPRAQLTPALTFLLMTGVDADFRLPGWVSRARGVLEGVPDLDHVWYVHGDALMAEAAAHGFVPYWPEKQTPGGDGFEAWRAGFAIAHRY